jgi:flavodoxin
MSKNGAIIYYSWIGNTKVVAEEIKRFTDFDIHEIEEKKQRKPGDIMGAAMSSFLGFQSNIKPMDFSLKKYDNVFLGTPVWAGKTTPAINRFIKKADFNGKKVWVFITKADDKVPIKVIESITNRIEKKGGKVMDWLSLTTKWDPKTNIPMTVEEFSKEIENWHKKINI